MTSVRFAFAALAASSALAFAHPVFAQDAAPPPPAAANAGGPDAVVLKDGTTLRGRLVEIVQNQVVRLQMPDGKIANVKWEVIERVEQATPLAPPAPPPATPPPPPPAASTTLVHVDAEVPVVLEQATYGTEDWHPVCESPCDVALPVQAGYRINGPGTRRSKPFMISPTADGRAVLDVQRASTSAFALGITFVATGPIVFLIGLTVTALGAIANNSAVDCTNGSGSRCTASDAGAIITTGIVLMGIGIGGTVIGGILLGNNTRTKVGQVGITVPGYAGRMGDLVRRPTWYGELAPVPNATTVPILALPF
jgi:hypothetical protein